MKYVNILKKLSAKTHARPYIEIFDVLDKNLLYTDKTIHKVI